MMSVLHCSYSQDSANVKNDVRGVSEIVFLMGIESEFVGLSDAK